MYTHRPLGQSSPRPAPGVYSPSTVDVPVAGLMGCLLLIFSALHNIVLAQSTSPDIAMDPDSVLARELRNAVEAMEDGYIPRTDHFLDNGQPKYVNRLILEHSPYLLQHAHNPVNWYPWGDEAFETATRQNKPVFLSIGYATCHWCHVMERESFEDEAIAALMNASFIAIKVDREQLPDVDSWYMKAVMMMTGNGGWPMSSFLDTEGRTFFGGTYFQPDQFMHVLERISTLWRNDQSVLLDQATLLADAMKQANELSSSPREVGEALIHEAASTALSQYDDFQGGFSRAPKFPRESLLHFLLDQAERTGDTDTLEAVNFSLQRMAAGGIHDQIGGGFHRYAVDDDWLVPHFEKMLYNQGSLARNYSQAYRLTGDKEHLRTARRILDYVLRDMRSEDGLFYSATDADSDGGEGRFFTWLPEELVGVLGQNEAELAQRLWGVTESGHLEGRSILHQPVAIDELAVSLGMDVARLSAERDRLADKLFAHRQTRIPPLRDEKIITAWNSLMITALAESSETMGDARYKDAAIQAADTLWKSARPDANTLWRTRFNGKLTIEGRQSDYAYFAEALLMLYDITGSPVWLERSEELTAAMLEHFWDRDSGGFFMTRADSSSTALVIRQKDLFDASMSTGNAVAMRVLSRLFKRTGDTRYSDFSESLIAFFADSLHRQSHGHYYLLTGVSDYLLGETGTRQFGAQGVVKASTVRVDDGSLAVLLDIAPGWHINSNEPYQDYLIPTTLRAIDGTFASITYPAAIDRQLGFQRAQLSLYQGSVVLRAITASPDVRQLQIQLQACSDEVCLPPESLTLTVPR
ncbi:MAG: DUF255 domain-containing protein [Granulosicoccus sp.]|nr:DUF255 domain-containing protein [Granulosicoccus sp.]